MPTASLQACKQQQGRTHDPNPLLIGKRVFGCLGLAGDIGANGLLTKEGVAWMPLLDLPLNQLLDLIVHLGHDIPAGAGIMTKEPRHQGSGRKGEEKCD